MCSLATIIKISLRSCKIIYSEKISEPAFLTDFQVILVPSLIWETERALLYRTRYTNLGTIHFFNFCSWVVYLELYFASLLSLPSAIQISTQHVSGCICYNCNDHHWVYYSGHSSKQNQSSLALENNHLLPSFHSRCKFLETLIFLELVGSIFSLQPRWIVLTILKCS